MDIYCPYSDDGLKFYWLMKRYRNTICLPVFIIMSMLSYGCGSSTEPGSGPYDEREQGRIRGDCLLWSSWSCKLDMLEFPLAAGSRLSLYHDPAYGMPAANVFWSSDQDVLNLSGFELFVMKKGRGALLALSQKYYAIDFRNIETEIPAGADIVRSTNSRREMEDPGPVQVVLDSDASELDVQVILRSDDGHPLGGKLDWQWLLKGPFSVSWISNDAGRVIITAQGNGQGLLSVRDEDSGFEDTIKLRSDGFEDGFPDAGMDSGADSGSDSGTDGGIDGGAPGRDSGVIDSGLNDASSDGGDGGQMD